MAEQMDWGQTLVRQRQLEVLSHKLVTHVGGVRRTAVISLIDGKDLKIRGKFLADGMPILERAEETV